jgi:hypothetical protein
VSDYITVFQPLSFVTIGFDWLLCSGFEARNRRASACAVPRVLFQSWLFEEQIARIKEYRNKTARYYYRKTYVGILVKAGKPTRNNTQGLGQARLEKSMTHIKQRILNKIVTSERQHKVFNNLHFTIAHTRHSIIFTIALE